MSNLSMDAVAVLSKDLAQFKDMYEKEADALSGFLQSVLRRLESVEMEVDRLSEANPTPASPLITGAE
jgi:uncharacterized protein YicC (UPF0701 family)